MAIVSSPRLASVVFFFSLELVLAIQNFGGRIIDDVQVAFTTHPRFWWSIVVVYFRLFNLEG